MEEKNICGAKTRKGTPCKNPPVTGRDRCRMHGGTAKRGPNSHLWKTGLYSKYAGESLKEVLDELEDISGEDLINPDNEIRLMQALILKCKALESGANDLRELDTISKIIDRLITAKQRSQAIQTEQNRLIPISDIDRFMTYLEDLLNSRLGDSKTRRIIDELKLFKLTDNET